MIDVREDRSIRLVVTDVDGTLLDAAKRVSPRTRLAFQHIAATGVAVALASSRMPASLRVVEGELGVPCWKLAYDGALLAGPRSDGAERHVSAGIDGPTVEAVLKAATAEYIGVYAGDAWICNGDGRWSEREAGNTGVQPVAVVDLPAAARRLQAAGPVHKIMLRGDPDEIAGAKAMLAGMPFQTARWFSNSDSILEIVPAAASKALGLTVLLEELGISAERVLAFGDGHNDLPLLAMVGQSVAVANAIEPLKALARHVTGRGDADGVAEYLEALVAAAL